MTLSEQLQRAAVLHLCADPFFADIAIVPDAMGYSPQAVLNAVAGMATPRPEGAVEPDPVTDFRAWLEWRNLGRGLGVAIVVNFPQAVDAVGEQIATAQTLQLTVQEIENPDFNRSENGLGIPGPQVQEAIDQALSARQMMLCNVPRSLHLRKAHPKDYESPEEGVVMWNVHFHYLGGPAVKNRVSIGGLEWEQVSGSEHRARVTSGTEGATICLLTVPADAEFPILPTPDNVQTTVALNEWLTLTIDEPVTLIAMGYKDGYTPSVEIVADVVPVLTLNATLENITATGATIRYNDVGAGTVLVQIKKADDPDWTNPVLDTTGTGDSYVIDELPWWYPGYVVRVKLGSLEWEELGLDLLPDITPQIGPQPLNIPGGQQGQPEIIDPLDTPLVWYLDGAPQNGGLATTQLTLTGLALGSYLLKARIETAGGNGPWSNEINVYQHD